LVAFALKTPWLKPKLWRAAMVVCLKTLASLA
jgi:hypothetical protein